MYENYYNLKAMPFQITTDPRFLWLGEKHSEALATLKYGILENKGFLLLTGDVGTGKTALINRLVRIIDVAAIVAKVPDPGLSSLDFFNFLSVELKMNKHFESKGAFLIHLKHFLHKAYSNRKRVLLIIDEAQRLNHELLEQIRLLSNIELQNRKLINIFFVGQTEFGEMLMQERNRAVRQRITVSYHINPLTESEARYYIKHRLKVAGASREIFTKDALREIFSFSDGYPRLINIICDHALLTGYAAGLKAIDRKVIKECERELEIPLDVGGTNGNGAVVKEAYHNNLSASEPDKTSILKRTGIILVFILLLVSGVYYIATERSGDEPRWSMEEIAPQRYEGATPEAQIAGEKAKAKAEELQAVQPRQNLSSDENETEKGLRRPAQQEESDKTPDNNLLPNAEGKTVNLNVKELDSTLASDTMEAADTAEMAASTDAADKTEVRASTETADTTDSAAPVTIPDITDSADPVEVSDTTDSADSSDEDTQRTIIVNTQEAAPFPERKFTIYFKRNSNELPDQAFDTLNRIADFLLQKPNASIDIRGYTDSTGNYSYNMSVSEFRANTIKIYLVGKGVDSSKIKSAGLGPQDPIASNETAAGRRKNRRVEIEIITNQ